MTDEKQPCAADAGKKVGIYICYCGGNISDHVDVEAVRDQVENLPNVTVARTNMFMCSDPGQELIMEDLKNGTVDRVVVVVDCGIVVNPDAARNQVEGGVIDGIGHAMYSQLTFRDGQPQQSNFDKYRLIRHAEAPAEIEALVADFETPRLRTRCNIHKRLYTFMRDYKQPYLARGEFARLVLERGDDTRARYLLDPWNSPYWVRHKCTRGRAVALGAERVGAFGEGIEGRVVQAARVDGDGDDGPPRALREPGDTEGSVEPARIGQDDFIDARVNHVSSL